MEIQDRVWRAVRHHIAEVTGDVEVLSMDLPTDEPWQDIYTDFYIRSERAERLSRIFGFFREPLGTCCTYREIYSRAQHMLDMSEVT